MSFLTAGQRAVLRAVSSLGYANPFLPERVEYERAALGSAFVEGEPVWSYRIEHPEPRANVWRIQERLEPMVEQLRGKLAEGAEAREADLVLYEDAVLHLLYFRFWTKVMQELGLCDVREPATRLITQGIVLGADGEKMSKSRGNVVSPTGYVEKFGADATRLFVLFAGPVERDFAWNDAQVEGLHRFLVRVWRLVHRFHADVRPAGPPPREAQGRALELRRAARIRADLDLVPPHVGLAPERLRCSLLCRKAPRQRKRAIRTAVQVRPLGFGQDALPEPVTEAGQGSARFSGQPGRGF